VVDIANSRVDMFLTSQFVNNYTSVTTTNEQNKVEQLNKNSSAIDTAIKFAESSPQFQSLVEGYNYSFSSDFEESGPLSKGGIGLTMHGFAFELYSGPVTPGKAVKVAEVLEDPTFTKILNVTSYPAVYNGPAMFTPANATAGNEQKIGSPYPAPLMNKTINNNGTLVSPALHIPTYPSPLAQFKAGIAGNEVKCNDGLLLVLKAEDKTPACIRPYDIKALTERGWISAGEKTALKITTKYLCNSSHPPTPNGYTCPVSNSSAHLGNQTIGENQITSGIQIELANQTYEAGYPVDVNLKNVNQDYGCKIPSITVKDMSNQSLVFGPTPERDYGNTHCADPWHVTFYAGLENNSLVTKPTRYLIIAMLDNMTHQKEFTAIPSNYSGTSIISDSSQVLPGFLTFTSCLPIPNMPPNNGTLISYSGFDLYHRYLAGPDTVGMKLDDYLLRPGQTGSFVMQVHQGQFLPGHNLAGGLSFLSGNLLNVDNSTVWEPNRPVASKDHPGLDVSYSPIFAVAGPDGYATIIVTISARQDASQGSYWLYLPPGVCGGHRVLLTVGNKPLSQPPDYIGYDFDSNFVVDTAKQLVFELINPGIHTFENCTLGYTSKNQTTIVKTFDVILPGMEYKHIWNASSD
ncbi:MAG: hypothetical protein KGL95_11475, partial [Patescibacteria group bacterium]|nr:hypothetical protein [Patescibacteria group bacterium]